MATHEIRIDRSKTLLEEPNTGHNRWHPDIPPVVRCEPGDEVVLETRDAFDGQMGILTGHAPMMTLLGKGVLRLGTGGQRFNVDGGFLQVVDNTVRVVTEKASAA